MSGTPADDLRPTLFGNLPVDAWPPDDEATAEPWASFVRARQHLAAGDADLAVRAWVPIATFDGWEARHRLQAWHFLRAIGVRPEEQVASRVLGVVAELAIDGGHDVLAIYTDGSVRYLNHGGGAIVVDTARYDLMLGVSALLGAGQSLADRLGPWEGPELPPLGPGESRFTMLTPGGPVIGQGPDDALRFDPLAAPLYETATALLVAVMGATGS